MQQGRQQQRKYKQTKQVLAIQEQIQKDIPALKLQFDEFSGENFELRKENEKLNNRIYAFKYKMESIHQQKLNKNLLISGVCRQ